MVRRTEKLQPCVSVKVYEGDVEGERLGMRICQWGESI